MLARSADHVSTISNLRRLRKEVLLKLLEANRRISLTNIKNLVTRQPQLDIVGSVLFAQVLEHLMVEYAVHGKLATAIRIKLAERILRMLVDFG